MERSQAQSLARGGALLTVVSLVTPWYVVKAGGLTGLGKTGRAFVLAVPRPPAIPPPRACEPALLLDFRR